MNKGSARRRSIAGMNDRIVEQVSPIQPAKPLMRDPPAVDRAWNRQHAERPARGNFAALATLPKIVARREPRGRTARVDSVQASSRLGDDPKPVSAQSRHVRVNDAKDGVGRNRRVHGASAATQGVQSGAASEIVGRRDDAAWRARGRTAGLQAMWIDQRCLRLRERPLGMPAMRVFGLTKRRYGKRPASLTPVPISARAQSAAACPWRPLGCRRGKRIFSAP